MSDTCDCGKSDCVMCRFQRMKEREPLPVRSESSGWVSVNDELPKESGKYRVKIMRGSANVTTEETETLFFKKPHRSYWGIGGDWDVVTHWKPNDQDEGREHANK